MRRYPAERIVCLTEETVETLYLLGEEDRIVGVSGYAVRPPRVRKEKPRISSFLSADVARITALKPDLVLAFSDIQGPIIPELARAGRIVSKSEILRAALKALADQGVAKAMGLIEALPAVPKGKAKKV